MKLTAEKQATTCLKKDLKGKPLNEVVNNGWNRLSELYGVNMKKLSAQHHFNTDKQCMK
ncbi:MAG: hypothetical protein FWD60_01940 [Candidatus Azobacteroides sp.]|nr:hypothetical protein [Candidatus Azobacteroides sp.]